MNPSDIETMNKLKELRDKGVLTQEEFDEQIAVYLNPSNPTTNLATNQQQINTQQQQQGGYTFLWLIVICIAGYILVETAFTETILCNDNASTAKCECFKQVVARNASFMDKVKILFVGASKEELESYLGANALLCAFR